MSKHLLAPAFAAAALNEQRVRAEPVQVALYLPAHDAQFYLAPMNAENADEVDALGYTIDPDEDDDFY